MEEILGKRKRRADLDTAESSLSHEDDGARLQILLQKHFEAKYEPLEFLPVPKAVHHDTSSQSSSEDDDEWSGLSDTEGRIYVQTVEHVPAHDSEPLPKEELRTFMTTRPPSSQVKVTKVVRSEKQDASDDPTTEASLIASDLALQRLLRESHLLDPSNLHSNSSLAPTGAARNKALDLRLQSLGVKASLTQQKSMPMSHRRGIEQKKKEKEADRRKEAREAGIILEKEKRGTKEKRTRDRVRAVGAPGVGRMKGGTLTLSKRDVAKIEGHDTRSRRPGKKGR